MHSRFLFYCIFFSGCLCSTQYHYCFISSFHAGHWCPNPIVIVQEAGYTLDKLQVLYRATKLSITLTPRINVELPISLMFMFWSVERHQRAWRKKLVCTERTYKLYPEGSPAGI